MTTRSVLTEKGRTIRDAVMDCRRHLAAVPESDIARAIERLADAVERIVTDSEALWSYDNGENGGGDDNGGGGGQAA